ncbi:MAG: sugar kinase [Turicibacter sp.]|nr:sugar kinase [Turicibacter sp.]
MKKFATIGEVMQRLTPPNHDKLEQATSFNVTYGGSEANIAIAMANFGHDVSMATILPLNPLGISAKRSLQKYGINTAATKMSGDILGSYYLEVGHSVRSSQVVYNRKFAAIALAEESVLDVEEVLEGRTHLHLSGITLALGPGIRAFTMKLAKTAFERGITISFDFNYRAKLWTVEEAKPVLGAILPYVHVVFGSMWDIETFAGIDVGEFNSLEEKRQAVFSKFLSSSNCQVIFGTIRQAHSTHKNSLQAYAYFADDQVDFSRTYEFEIIDRVGGGDAFVSGVMHQLDLSAKNYKESAEFGMASGVLKHTISGDVLLTTEEEIKNMLASPTLGGIAR